MGCFSSRRERQMGTAAIEEQLRKVRLVSQSEQLKLTRNLKNQEDLLVSQFSKAPAFRSALTEKAMIRRTVYTKNLLTIYVIIENESRKVFDNRALLANQQTLTGILPSLQTLLYASTYLNDQSLQRLNNLAKMCYPGIKIPTDEEIKYQLIRYHRHTDQVTFEMENTLILDLGHRRNVEVIKINEVGHAYGYRNGTISYSTQMLEAHR